jgi:hypothetical protein
MVRMRTIASAMTLCPTWSNERLLPVVREIYTRMRAVVAEFFLVVKGCCLLSDLLRE